MSSPIQNRIDFLVERAKKQNPAINEKKIRAAYECAAGAHEGQKRRNGEPTDDDASGMFRMKKRICHNLKFLGY